MKKTLSLLGLATFILAGCKKLPSDSPERTLYVETRENPVLISNLSYNSVHKVKYSSDSHPTDAWFFTGVYDIRNRDSVLISTTPVKNGAGTDTICGDWFGIMRNKHYMEVFIAENNTGHSRKLRIQYAADGAVGKDLVIEQQK